ncbi:rho GTPase-activating protein 6 isoform X2 [Fundulus heteroclitus]|uniref:rho GTPase-activating protein 6 isoform X2 n=1 Tax=Fundulus heteroclitus TaxID=8078 RepID=UPI00165B1E12|nr:rho GTPase-activating protein 6 isoform X2 [Fundulus heteroclitus]
MAAQGLLSSVFSCSLSPKSISKKKLRQTRSLDSTLMRHCGTEAEEAPYKGDITWNTSLGPSVCLKPVPLQSLSELERVRLQEVAFRRLIRCHDLGCHITIPKYGHKHKTSLRKKLDSLSKEKNKDKETSPQTFGIPLSHVITNDVQRLRHDHLQEEHSNPTELMLSFLHLSSSFKRTNKELSSSNSSLSSTPESHNESPLPSTPDTASRTSRRGGVSVDCITDLDDNQSRLLEALQLSLPDEAAGNRKKIHDKKFSLNPIYRQVPRIVDLCCQHLEKNGLQTVGIFRIGSSKKRVRQLREEFNQGWEVHFDDEHCVHDVAALLKKFLRDLPDPLLTRELYTAFIHTMLLDYSEQQSAIQLLVFLLPPCNSDTLQRILSLLSTVSSRAEDSLDPEGRKIPGNKMTSRNLATILGPNLLHKQKNPDKEFAVQSFAHAEESTAIISVVQRMIDAYDMLFMVPADLQNEVLFSLLETDSDVVEYLLRRKASQCSDSGILRPEDSFSLTESCMSSDSLKASSGEVSPYDNNSPVLSDRLLLKDTEDSSLNSDRDSIRPRQYKLSDRSKDGSGSTSPTLSADKDASADCFWDTWHELFGKDFISHQFTGGSLGDASECDSYGSSEGLSSHQGNNKLPIRATQTPLGVLESRPHLPATCSSSDPYDHREERQPESLHQSLSSQSGAVSSDSSVQRTGRPPCPIFMDRTEGLSPRQCSGPLSETSNSRCALSVFKHQADVQTLLLPQQSSALQTVDAAEKKSGPDCSNLQTEKWHVWQMMSSKNPETLPESLV